MSSHKPDLDNKECEYLLKKITEYKLQLDKAHKDFEVGVLTAHIVAEAAENYRGALEEYDHHCPAKKIT